MNKNTIDKRNKLFESLNDEFVNSAVNVRPRSPQKYEREEETAINLCYPDKHWICGVEPQANGKIKMWFRNPEWETETSYPVKEFARNGNGAGSGKGFYVESVEDCVAEARAYIKRYYPQID